MGRRNAAVADPTAGHHDEEPKRFGVRDLRNDTAGVLEEAERSGACTSPVTARSSPSWSLTATNRTVAPRPGASSIA